MRWAEPCVRLPLVPPWPGPGALVSALASESDVESWDWRASFTEYLWAMRRDRRDFHDALPVCERLPLLWASGRAFCPARRGGDLDSRLRNTSSRDGRMKSVQGGNGEIKITCLELSQVRRARGEPACWDNGPIALTLAETGACIQTTLHSILHFPGP